MGKVGDRAPISAKIPSRGLPAALQEMSNNYPLCQLIPIIPTPAQFMYHGSKEECSIGDTTGQHNVRARV